MTDIISEIENAKQTAQINVYAVRHCFRGVESNIAVSLPSGMNTKFREDFCNSIMPYKDFRCMDFNPVSDSLSAETYEFVPLENVAKIWGNIKSLIDSSIDYNGKLNRSKVTGANLFVCQLDYRSDSYYFLAVQRTTSDSLFKGRLVLTSSQDNLIKANSGDVFVMETHVGMIICPSQQRILILDKKAFQQVFHYDDYIKEYVLLNLGIIDDWSFLQSAVIIKERVGQKKVYSHLAKIFLDEAYLRQIQEISPLELKRNLLSACPDNFSAKDFSKNKLRVTSENLEIVLRMLSKGYKYNFFTNSAE